MKEAIGVGIIGCGAIAQLSHIRTLQDYDEKFSLIALADVGEPLLHDVGEHFGVARDRRYAH